MKVEMIKGKRRVVMRGLTHIDSAEHFDKLQEELDSYIERGFQIFYESVGEDLEKKISKNEDQVFQFLEFFLKLYPVLGGVVGFEQQDFEYPDEAINADITMQELAQKLVAINFHRNPVFRLFRWALSIKTIQEKLSDPNQYTKFSGKFAGIIQNENLKEEEKPSVVIKMLLTILTGGLMPVVGYYRSKVAMGIVSSSTKNAFVHYGRGHVPLMITILKRLGYQVINLDRSTV